VSGTVRVIDGVDIEPIWVIRRLDLWIEVVVVRGAELPVLVSEKSVDTFLTQRRELLGDAT